MLTPPQGAGMGTDKEMEMTALTDERIKQIVGASDQYWATSKSFICAIARAVESALAAPAAAAIPAEPRTEDRDRIDAALRQVWAAFDDWTEQEQMLARTVWLHAERAALSAAPVQQPAADERKAFEAWAVKRDYPLERNDRGVYLFTGTVEVWEGWQARAALQSPTSAAPQAVGAETGWRLVPTEPTDEMLEAGRAAGDFHIMHYDGPTLPGTPRYSLRQSYEAMLAAAPAPGGESEPVAWQWRKKGEPWSLDKTFNSQVFATTPDSEVRPLYSSPIKQEMPEALSEEQIHAIFRVNSVTHGDCHGDCDSYSVAALRAINIGRAIERAVIAQKGKGESRG